MSIHRTVDARGHRQGCPDFDPDCPPLGDPQAGYTDLFCDTCHSFDAPEIGGNRTDVAYPSGWTEQMASAWRAKNGLARPSEPGSGP